MTKCLAIMSGCQGADGQCWKSNENHWSVCSKRLTHNLKTSFAPKQAMKHQLANLSKILFKCQFLIINLSSLSMTKKCWPIITSLAQEETQQAMINALQMRIAKLFKILIPASISNPQSVLSKGENMSPWKENIGASFLETDKSVWNCFNFDRWSEWKQCFNQKTSFEG